MTCGVVTEHLINLIAKQVGDNGIVVWYDPDGTYSEAVDVLDMPETTIDCQLSTAHCRLEMRHDT